MTWLERIEEVGSGYSIAARESDSSPYSPTRLQSRTPINGQDKVTEKKRKKCHRYSPQQATINQHLSSHSVLSLYNISLHLNSFDR